MNIEQFYIISATLIIVATVLSVLLIVYTWLRRHTADVRYFLWFLVFTTGWELSAVLSFTSPTPELAQFWISKVKFINVAIVPVAFLVFALNYAGHTRWLKPRNLVLLGIIPLITQVLNWTNSPFFITDYVIQNYGPYQIEVSQVYHQWFWIHASYSYSLIVIGLIFLTRFAIQSRYPYRSQAIIIMICAFFVLIANVVNISGLITPDPPEFSSLTFGAATFVWTWALFRYKIMDVMPVARDAVVESMTDAVIVVDVQNRIVDLNPAAEAMVAFKSSSVIGQHLQVMWPGQEKLIDSYDGVKEAHTEIVIGQGADRRVFDLTVSTFYRRKDEEAGRLVVLRDITPRKLAETEREKAREELARQAQQHTAQLEALHRVTLGITAELEVKELLKKLSSSAFELLDATGGGIYIYHPERDTLEWIVAVGQENTPFGSELKRGEGLSGKVMETGTPIAVDNYAEWEGRAAIYENIVLGYEAIVGVPIRAGEKFLGVLNASARAPRKFSERDIYLLGLFANQAAVAIENARLVQELQSSEESLNEFMNSSTDSYSLWDSELNLIEINPVGLEMLNIIMQKNIGMTREQAIGKHLLELSPGLSEGRYEEYQQILETGNPVTFQGIIPRSDVKKMYVIINGFKVGKGLGFSVIDITERVQAEEEREKLIEDLNAYSHTVAHDLKNPLGIIMGYASVIQDIYEDLPEDLKGYLQIIADTSSKMNNIIEELLLLASIRNQPDIELSPIDMAEVIKGAMSRLSRIAEESSAQIKQPARWPIAQGYPPWVEEIWANYISNGIKYGGSPPLIELGSDQQNDMIRFWVKDNGDGMTKAERDSLFSEFSRLEQHSNQEGHGLGLSIAKRIAETLGGEAGVESVLDEGSLFYFTLPGVTIS